VIDCQLDFSLLNPDVQNLGNVAQIAVGQLSMYDGAAIVEQNFHIYPEIIGISNGGSGSLSAGTYGYIVTYEWQDNQGQLHRSTGSPISTVTASASSKNTLTIPTLRVTNKTGVVIKIYRTQVNQNFYYLVNTAFSDTANDPTVDSITYIDGVSDASLLSNIQLYTNGELNDFAPPAPAALSNFKNRLLMIGSEGGYDLFYSKQVVPGFPVEMVQEFDQNIGTVGGPVSAVAGMDDKIIIFKSGLVVGNSILYMVGTGPSASGANNDFQDPLPVAVDCGCVDRSSIVMTPNGLIFKSNKGIYILSRGLEASYIGAAVEGFNSYKVLSAQLIPNTTQVRFLLNGGPVLMFDYFYGRWATFSCPSGVSDCIFQGQHTYVTSAGQVYQESPGTYLDGTTPVLISFKTANINLANVSGYERIYEFLLLAQYLSPHTLNISIFYDYSTTAAQTVTISPTNYVAGAGIVSNLEQWRVHMKQQLCQTFQLLIQEQYDSTYGVSAGAGLTITGMTMKLGVKKGIRPIRGANAAGLS
jgi:hypothetical protein